MNKIFYSLAILSGIMANAQIGNVGVGTATPQSKLHVDGAGSTNIKVTGTGAGYTQSTIELLEKGTENYRGSGMIMSYENPSTPANNYSWYAGRPYGGSFGTSDQFVIQRLAQQNNFAAAAGYTDGGGQALAKNYLTVNNIGNIGIGTISPAALLNVYKDQAATTRILVENTGTVGATTAAAYSLGEAGTPHAELRRFRDGSGKVELTNIQAAPLLFSTTDTERMRILANGNVGINNNNPTSRLDIVPGAVTGLTIAAPTGVVNSTNIYANNNAYGLNVIGGATAGQSYGGLISAGTNANDLSFGVRNYAASQYYLYVRGDGNTGIGATDPAERLDINGYTKGRTGFYSSNVPNGSGTPVAPSGGIVASPADLVSVTNIGSATNYGSNWIKFSKGNIANNDASAWIGAVYNSNYSHDLAFCSGKKGNAAVGNTAALNMRLSEEYISLHTTDDAALNQASVERVRINKNGVGIGVNNPTAKLQVSQSGANAAVYALANTPTGTHGGVFYGGGAGHGVYGEGYSTAGYGVYGRCTNNIYAGVIGYDHTNSIYGKLGDSNYGVYSSAKTYSQQGYYVGSTGNNYADYVLESYVDGKSTLKPEYTMKSLTEVEAYIKKNKHLPGIKSINELEVNPKDGNKIINMSELQLQLLEKVEELYLHSIEQQKQIEGLKSEITALKNK